MDRRSWLWRRKSSDKSSGETESLGSGSGSGSIISSPSERFSDEQQVYAIQNAQSPEITSKVISHVADANDSVKILSEKLSAAVSSIREKEELVKQHSKVADEAVSGWERAEEEVNVLKQQLDAATKKNFSLEDRVVHLDGALKECLRQLRQVREEQDQRNETASTSKSEDTEPKSSELQDQLADLRAQLDAANTKAEAATSLESDLRLKLASFEKENTSLKLELRSRVEELEVRILERDLSTKRAETASKHHLDSIKKVAKLEAECRMLKAMSRKAALSNHRRSFSVASSHAGSQTDGLSDGNELVQFKADKSPSKNHVAPTPSEALMDDFLEMEKLAALPGRESRSLSSRSTSSTDKHIDNGNEFTPVKDELEAMINRTAELEEKIEMVEAEKVAIGLALTQCQDRAKLSESTLEHLRTQFNECQNELKMSQAQLRDANKKLGMLQAELDLASELRQAIDLELDDVNVRREEAEAQRYAVETETQSLLAKVSFLEGEAEKERTMYAEASAKCRSLEEEISRMKQEADTWQSQLASMNDSKDAIEKELRGADGMKTAVESQRKALQAEVKSLLAKNVSLEYEAKKERLLSAELDTKCKKLETELSTTKCESEIWHNQFASATELKEAVTRELQLANAKKEELELQLKVIQGEAESLRVRVNSLELEIEKERALSAEFAVKCRSLEDELPKMKPETNFQFAQEQVNSLLVRVNSLELELEQERILSAEFALKCRKLDDELSKMKVDVDCHFPLLSKEELNKQQEQELAVAASKFAECQKTIASLGNQLKSLATIEDLFVDSENHLTVPDKDAQLLGTDSDAVSTTLPSSSTEQSDSGPPGSQNKLTVNMKDDQESAKEAKGQPASVVLDRNHRNGFGKLFSRARSTVRSQNT